MLPGIPLIICPVSLYLPGVRLSNGSICSTIAGAPTSTDTLRSSLKCTTRAPASSAISNPAHTSHSCRFISQ